MLLRILFTAFLIINSVWAVSKEKADSVVYEYSYKEPLPVHPRNAQIIMHILSRNHYKKMSVDDSVSSQIFTNFIETLDYYRSYFLDSDIVKLEKYRFLLDDAIKTGNLNAAYKIYNLFQDRFKERQDYIKKRLDKPFNFTINEQYQPDRSMLPWVVNSAQLDSIWQLRLKNDFLKLKLTSKEDEEIIKTLKKRYAHIEKNIKQTESEDVFQWFMNAFTETYDPHTSYMSPKTSEDFGIRMSLALEGIGAQLRNENDYTKIVKIIPGGPADKSGLLHANDLITGVAQGEDGEMVDVVGWRIDDVVQLIRGKKGTTVRLQIIGSDASLGDPQELISIVRDKVKLEDSAAQSDTLEVERNGKKYKLGVIDIPSFYFDYEEMRKGNTDFKSTTRDVRRIIKELQSAQVDGLIIDLRNNGGGFLNEAIELTGLFIDQGPVVQVRNTNGRVKVEKDLESGIAYDGPLVVLVNRLSASASEIFAAAIQDFDRGIIIGTQSFGKGTVQNVVKLDRFFSHSNEKYGQVKMTIAKFYRINGGSTQHKGVLPDIGFPSRYEFLEVGESEQENALRWDEIRKADYVLYNKELDNNLPRLQKRHYSRIAGDPEFKYLEEDIAEIKKQKEKKFISLNIEKRKAVREENEQRKKERKEARKKNGTEDDDFTIAESAQVLVDYIQIEEKK